MDVPARISTGSNDSLFWLELSTCVRGGRFVLLFSKVKQHAYAYPGLPVPSTRVSPSAAGAAVCLAGTGCHSAHGHGRRLDHRIDTWTPPRTRTRSPPDAELHLVSLASDAAAPCAWCAALAWCRANRLVAAAG